VPEAIESGTIICKRRECKGEKIDHYWLLIVTVVGTIDR
jgi:hypothetical protein